MSTTKNGRIRKLIAAINEHKPSNERSRPHESRMMEHTVSTKNKETGEVIKNKTTIIIIDNTYGRNERRKMELERLITALGPKKDGYYDSPLKKNRMKKFAHKKQKAKEDNAPKKGKKGGK